MRSTRKHVRRGVAAITLAALVAACGNGSTGGGSEDAEVADDLFAGEDVTIVLSTGPGGGASEVALSLSPHWETYLPGGPGVNVEYVEGGGGQVGINEFVLRRDDDGLTVLQGPISHLLPGLVLADPNVRWEADDLYPVLAATSGGVMAGRADAFDGLEDLLDPSEPLVSGELVPDGLSIPWLLAWEVLDLDVQVVFGYETTAAKFIAFEQGETNLDQQNAAGYLANTSHAVEAGEAVELFSLGVLNDGEIEEDPDFPGVPTLYDAHVELYGEPPSGPAWDAYLAVLPIVRNVHTTFLHSTASDEVQAAWSEAAQEIAANHAEEVQETGGMFPIAGEDLDAAVDAMSMDPDVQQWLIEFLVDNHGLQQ